jgi:hypothetical protein
MDTITMNKNYQTADGRTVRLLTKDMKNRDGYTVLGIVTREDGTEFAMQWRDDGTCWDGGSWERKHYNAQLNLVLAPTKHHGYVLVSENTILEGKIYVLRRNAEDRRANMAYPTDYIIVPLDWED